MDFAVD